MGANGAMNMLQQGSSRKDHKLQQPTAVAIEELQKKNEELEKRVGVLEEKLSGNATVQSAAPLKTNGFFCNSAWCSEGSLCCDNGNYGLCGSPSSSCCYSPSGIINICSPGSCCNLA